MAESHSPRETVQQRDPMRVYVLWAASGRGDDLGRTLSEGLCDSLDALGMVRDGIGFRVPVRHRSLPWRDDGRPRPIDWDAAEANVFVIVLDDLMQARAAIWDPYLEELLQQAEQRGDLVLPVMVSKGADVPSLARRGLQAIVAPAPRAESDAARWHRRVTMYLMGCAWVHQRRAGAPSSHASDPRRISVFISHAKRDGETAGRLLRRFANVAEPGDDGIAVPAVNSIDFFFDTYDTIAGARYAKQFEDSIAEGALLAIVTDNYHSRVWCLWEVLTAKRYQSPIVVWDVSHRGSLRSGPYLGNVPVVRMPDVRYLENDMEGTEEIDLDTVTDADVELILLTILSEALRMAVWSRHARQLVDLRGIPAMVVCARPPELADLSHAKQGEAIVYPDPPMNQHEIRLIRQVFPEMRVLTLSEVQR